MTLQLVRAIQDGEAQAFNALFARVERRLQSYIHARMTDALRGATAVEDVLQETYLRAWQAFDRFQPQGPRSPFAWLAAIAGNVIVDSYRRHTAARRGGGAVVSIDTPAPGSDPEARPLSATVPETRRAGISTILDRQGLSGRVLAALDELSDDYRNVLLLRQFEGLSASEVGERMGRSANAVRLLHSRALRALAEHVRGQGGDEKPDSA